MRRIIILILAVLLLGGSAIAQKTSKSKVKPKAKTTATKPKTTAKKEPERLKDTNWLKENAESLQWIEVASNDEATLSISPTLKHGTTAYTFTKLEKNGVIIYSIALFDCFERMYFTEGSVVQAGLGGEMLPYPQADVDGKAVKNSLIDAAITIACKYGKVK